MEALFCPLFSVEIKLPFDSKKNKKLLFLKILVRNSRDNLTRPHDVVTVEALGPSIGLRSVNCSVILQSAEEMFYTVKRRSSTIG
jgi:hypothetical protein